MDSHKHVRAGAGKGWALPNGARVKGQKLPLIRMASGSRSAGSAAEEVSGTAVISCPAGTQVRFRDRVLSASAWVHAMVEVECWFDSQDRGMGWCPGVRAQQGAVGARIIRRLKG